MSVNRVILVGNLGKDAVMKFTASGVAVCRFSLATNEKFKNKAGEVQQRTEWHTIVAWGKLAEVCGQYLTKGKLVYIEGCIRSGKWEDQSGNERKSVDIVASQMRMLSSSNGNGGKAKAQNSGPAPNSAAPKSAAAPSESDNPFEAEDSDVPY